MSDKTFHCKLSDKCVSFPHFWEHTVGSCHATLALRADWQRQLARCNRELGFKHVRFHGILSDDMGTLVQEDDKLIYSFFNGDQICDFLLSINMRPFMELSFMPEALSSGSKTVFHYKSNITPPRDYEAWQEFITKIIQHWVDRYGLEEVKNWFFEVWNEPNLKSFWKSNQAGYFRLYEHTAKAIKNVHAELKVGGPATAKNAWISEFLDHCKEKDIPVDFISTHHYPTDALGKPTDDTVEELSKVPRNILHDDVIATEEKAKGHPVYYTEWSTSSNPFDELHDLPYAAAHIIRTIMLAQGHVNGYSYWTFSDIFEENYFSSVPFHGGFGLLNIHGIPKPAYRAFELLHRLGTDLVPVNGNHATVDAWVIKNGKQTQAIITNSALPKHLIEMETVYLELDGIQTIKNSFIERIDEEHANATSAWKRMASPGSLNAQQVKSLEVSSLLKKEPLEINLENSTAQIKIDIPPQGVVCVTIETE